MNFDVDDSTCTSSFQANKHSPSSGSSFRPRKSLRALPLSPRSARTDHPRELRAHGADSPPRTSPGTSSSPRAPEGGVRLRASERPARALFSRPVRFRPVRENVLLRRTTRAVIGGEKLWQAFVPGRVRMSLANSLMFISIVETR